MRLAPRGEIERAQVDAVDLDRARLRIVEAAEQLRERRLAGAVLADDRERRSGRNGEIESVEHERRIARARRLRADTRSARRESESRAPGCPRAGRSPDASAPVGGHRLLESQHGGDRRRRAVDRPTESAERDERHAERALRVGDELSGREASGGDGARERPRRRATFAATTSR